MTSSSNLLRQILPQPASLRIPNLHILLMIIKIDLNNDIFFQIWCYFKLHYEKIKKQVETTRKIDFFEEIEDVIQARSVLSQKMNQNYNQISQLSNNNSLLFLLLFIKKREMANASEKQSSIQIFKQTIEAKNKEKYLQTVKSETQHLGQYEENYRQFMYFNALFNGKKSAKELTDYINKGIGSLQMKEEVGQIMKDIGKLYVQELMEELIQVVEGKDQMDVKMVELAYFRLCMKKKQQSKI